MFAHQFPAPATHININISTNNGHMFTTDANFQHTGLERSAALAADLQFMQQQFSLPPPVVQDDGPGATYAAVLRRLAAEDPQSFICHYYNFYFAHTAGGRMIGKKVGVWAGQAGRQAQ